MNAPIQIHPMPDVEGIQRLTDLNQVNDFLKNGWVLLSIPITRMVNEQGSFSDKPVYIIGMRRDTSETTYGE